VELFNNFIERSLFTVDEGEELHFSMNIYDINEYANYIISDIEILIYNNFDTPFKPFYKQIKSIKKELVTL
jgi:hypothetical protein